MDNTIKNVQDVQKFIKLCEELTGKKIVLKEEYSGGKFELPADHKPGMKVPKGGSMCANCKFHNKEDNTCGNKYWLQWHENNNKIPNPGDEYCCDWFLAK